MPLPAIYLRATLNFENDETKAKATCALWYSNGSGGTSPTLATVSAYANSFRTAYSSAIAGWLPDTCRMTRVTLKWVAAGAEIEGDSTAGPVQGTIAGEVLPEEDVLCVQRRTGLQGRNKRGRVFFPFVSESFQADGELNNAGIAAATALANMVKSVVVHSGGNWNPGTVNWKEGQLIGIVQSGFVRQTCSRRDRRYPKQLTSLRV